MAAEKKINPAEELHEWIDDNASSCEEFARWVGVTRQAVNLWISGMSTPSRDNAKKIEDVTEGAIKRTWWD